MTKRELRNGRKWREWDDMVVLTVQRDGRDVEMLARVQGVSELSRGVVIYTVEEVVSALRYPADAKNLRKAKDRAEVDRLIEARRAAGEARGMAITERSA